MKDENISKIADFLYELGTMRKLLRMHRQVLMTDDLSDNIASHSFRVAMIGWTIARAEKADVYKTVMMCLIHDFDELRSGDHNWVHKRYVRVDNEKIIKEQLEILPFKDLASLAREFEERKTKEAIIAKDADHLDQVFLLREYAWAGNKEAKLWLKGKRGNKEGNAQIKMLKTKTAKKIAGEIMKKSPSEWWKNLWTSENKK